MKSMPSVPQGSSLRAAAGRPESAAGPEPYRFLFPLGALLGAIGALLWLFHALGLAGYPAVTHAAMMIQGFETCFVLGFFLTAMPGFTHGEKCRPWELAVAMLAMLDFALFALLGATLPAQIAFCAAVLLLATAAARRVVKSGFAPPEEFVFVRLGLALGLAGAVAQIAASAGWSEPAPRFGQRLVSFGMVLSMVLGFGGLLVPTFAMMREPLGIPGIAKAGERPPRRLLYAVLALALLGAFVAEASSRPGLGAWIRAVVATLIGLLVWKLVRRPGRRDLLAWSLWSSGWLMVLGLVLSALDPFRAVGWAHLTFIGGFGLLTLGISTRVVVAHGGRPLEIERHVLTPWVVGSLGLALAVRVAAELVVPLRFPLLAASGVCWTAAWALWAAGAIPLLGGTRPILLQPLPAPARRPETP